MKAKSNNEVSALLAFDGVQNAQVALTKSSSHKILVVKGQA